MKVNLYTIIFSAVVGIICAGLLAGADSFTRPYVKANKRAEQVKNIMDVLGLSYPDNAGARKLLEIFEEKSSKTTVDGLTIYKYTAAEGDPPVAVLFQGSGVWGPIKGVLALEPDMRTIRDIAFYDQEETPGLGAKIATEEFTSRFEGKVIAPEDDGKQKAGLKITAPGEASGAQEVDGITGATMTSDRVEKMLNDVISEIVAKVNGNV